MYTIMRNIFINNYRKVVRDQTFIDRTDNLYHLNLPQDERRTWVAYQPWKADDELQKSGLTGPVVLETNNF